MTRTASRGITESVNKSESKHPKLSFSYSQKEGCHSEACHWLVLNGSYKQFRCKQFRQQRYLLSAHCSTLTDFSTSLSKTKQVSCCCSMKGQPSKLRENKLPTRKQRGKSSYLQLKGRAEGHWIICLPFHHEPAYGSPAKTLFLPPAVHSCGLPISSTIHSQSEQGADPVED